MKLKHVASAAALTLMMGCIFAYAQQPPEEKAEQTEQTTCCPDEAVPEKDVQSDEANKNSAPVSTQQNVGDEENGDGGVLGKARPERRRRIDASSIS